MRDSNDARGNMEKLGESAGAMAGRAADFGMEVSGSLFRAAADVLGDWWSSDAPVEAASWTPAVEQDCRSHFASCADQGVGATQATQPAGTARVAPKSSHAAMQADDAGVRGSAQIGDTRVEGAARLGASSDNVSSDGFERARPGYQLGYVARRNPAYRGRSFDEVEPELKRVWESRARTGGSTTESTGSWPEVRGFVDFAYQHE